METEIKAPSVSKEASYLSRGGFTNKIHPMKRIYSFTTTQDFISGDLTMRIKRHLHILLFLGITFCFQLSVAKSQCIATYQIEKLPSGLFQVSLIANTTYNSTTTPPENQIGTMQVTIRVRSGGFIVTNFTDLQHGFNNWSQTIYNSPIENPGFDYIAFGLNNPTLEIPFQNGQKVPLFTFENGGECTANIVDLIQITDPFYPPNASNSNSGQQLSVLGFGQPDAPICVDGNGAQDCTLTCGIEYKIAKRSDGRFQVSMIPRVTYPFNGIDNSVATAQVVVKVATGSFQVFNISDLIHTNLRWDTTVYRQPVENPGYDYIAFGLTSFTNEYTFIANQELPLFTFENGGDCSSSLVTLIENSDPFYPPNASNSNSGQQMTVGGFGQPDIPICVSGSGAQDCSTNCFLSCNDNVQVSLGLNCTAEILPDMVATALDLTCPGGTKSVQVRTMDNELIPTSPLVDITHLNQELLVSVVDDFSGNSCWGSIIVKDKTGPNINCQDIVVDCSENLSPNNPIIGFPDVRDNCLNQVSDITFNDEVDPNGCNSIYSSIVNRTWSANDGNDHGVASTCIQRIFLRKIPFDNIIFPIDRDGIDAPTLSCTIGAADPDIAGSPTLNGKSIYPSFEGFCDINVGFQDQIAGSCGGSSQILRTWTAVNNCDGAFRTHVQVISLIDLEAPVISCIPDTLEQSTGIHDCTTTFSLPSVNASDACSAVNVHMETPRGIINSNGGFLEGIEQGVHPIVYVAVDECGNIARCTTMIRVVDQNGPTAVCNNSQVAVGPSGWVDVNASTFDDGSFDDCCSEVTFLAERTDEELGFLDVLSFSCEDIGTTVPIILQVTDCFGNNSQCTANITVIHDNTTNIQCPSNRTVTCDTDLTDLNLFGAPALGATCSDPIFQVNNIFNIDSCGAGTIERAFSIIDGGVVTGTCNQIITIENESTFNAQSIVWPHDYLTLACGFESLDPDNLPFGFDQPKFDVTGSCNNIFMRFTDSNFDNSANPEGCFEIHRLWEVIDWCQYNPDNPSAGGIYTYTQIISVLNNVPPTFNCPEDITVDVTDGACETFVNLVGTAVDDCTPGTLMNYSYSIDIDNDGTQDISGLSNNASGTYPIGIHTITYTAIDDCGNASTCAYQFTVRDATPPVALCFFPDLVIQNTNGSLVALPDASVIGQPSIDNCTAFENLTFQVSPTLFTCDQVGSNPITLTVIDESGNAATCSGQINVIDLTNICPVTRSMVSISGNVITEEGAMIEDVQVSLDYNGVSPSVTNQDGAFQLDFVPVGGNYTVFPQKEDDPLNGISTFDLVVLSRHILGVQHINSPYKLIAADANRSGTITTYDLVVLRQMILRIIDEFPNNTAWRFVKQDFQFNDPTNPLQEHFPEVYTINNVPSNNMNIGSFIGIKVGDVNNNATINSEVASLVSQARSAVTLNIPDQYLKAGSMVEIPISATNWRQLLGFQFALQLDTEALEIQDITIGDVSNLTKDNFRLDHLQRGHLSVSWQQAEATHFEHGDLFTLKVRVKKSIQSTQAIALNNAFLSPEMYQEDDAHLIAKTIQLHPIVITEQLTLYQNQPNPFSTHTTIGFDLPSTQSATIRILSVTGKVVKSYDAFYDKGYQAVVLRKEDLPNEGVYYYQIETKQAIETKKMLIIK